MMDAFGKVELLAPAGSYDIVEKAILAGADAVYMGGAKFGARAFAKSVEEDKTTDGKSVLDAIAFAHSKGVKLYLTVNTLFKQKELKEIFVYLDDIVDAGVDAFIVQDLGVGDMLKGRYDKVPLHASTQMTITSSKGVNLVKNLGYKQVVLARELSLKEIKEIKKEVGEDIVLECFVHGSMCYCYSGACLLSSFIGGDSGNRGRCKGPCRLPYIKCGAKITDKEKYLLSMKDMCAGRFIGALINAGVGSFKIEGRMRSADYVYGVTKMYRKYIDMVNDGTFDTLTDEAFANDEKILLDLYNKGGFTNYYDKHNDKSMIQRFER